MVRNCVMMAAAFAALAVGCAPDPTEATEYQELAAELDSVREELAAAAAAGEEREAELREQFEEQLDVAEGEVADLLRDLESELEAAQEEVEELGLRYDDEVRAELRDDYDTAVAAACEEAADNPSRSVEQFVSFDSRWSYLDLDEQQMVDDVSVCAGPAREEAQLTREDAVAALAPIASVVLEAYMSDSQPEDLEEQLREEVGAITRGAVVEDPEADWVEALDRLETGYYCARRGCTVISVLDELVGLGVDGMPVETMGAGSMRVGTGDGEARPGAWTAYMVDGCYWERLDESGSIIANNFAMSAPQVQVTISSGDFAFNSRGCGRWLRF